MNITNTKFTFSTGIYTQRLIDRIEFNKLTVCLACGSFQCGFCPDYSGGHTTTASVYLVGALLVTLIVYHRLYYIRLFFSAGRVFS